MERFFESNPGFRSRIAHHIDFPDYGDDELLQIAELMLARSHYVLSETGRAALVNYIARRRQQPHFANARSIRNALDRARLHQANRLFESSNGPIDATTLSIIEAPDILASRVFANSDRGREQTQ
ncbi:MAG: hypothetical protein HC869_01720 [Rhodospirillales bacterium]|nr:hypothetical protein [Rhodospirillales bacterium]